MSNYLKYFQNVAENCEKKRKWTVYLVYTYVWSDFDPILTPQGSTAPNVSAQVGSGEAAPEVDGDLWRFDASAVRLSRPHGRASEAEE